MIGPTVTPEDLLAGMEQIAVSAVLNAACEIHQLPRWGVLLTATMAELALAMLPDWHSIGPALRQGTKDPAVVGAVVVFPFLTRTRPVRHPRLGVIVTAPSGTRMEARSVTISPVQPTTVVVGSLAEVAPHLVPSLDGLWPGAGV